MTHANVLKLALSNERARLQTAKTASERKIRAVWAKQIEKEIAHEEKHFPVCELSDDELLAELAA